MRILKRLILALCFAAAFLLSAGAMQFELTDGRVVDGEIVIGKPESLQVRLGDGNYEKIEWEKMSQKTLHALIDDPKLKLGTFAERYIIVTEEERVKKTEVEIKGVPRLSRPAKQTVISALFGSSLGMFLLLLIYAANLYAAYEVAAVRAYPAAMVCGVAAVVPVVGPVIFLCLPTRMDSSAALQEEQASAQHPAEAPPAFNPMQADAPGQAQSQTGAGGLHIAHEHPAAAAAGQTKTEVFKRGQFTFNRRFIETKFSGFFGVVRRSDSKDMVLLLKTVRGEYVAERISRIASNDMHVETRKGEATQEVAIPFAEIQEIHLKHKNA